jgi:hypothetical protein
VWGISASVWMNTCPVGTVTAEIADTERALREVAAELMASWAEQGSAYRGWPEAEARSVIHALLIGRSRQVLA